MKKVRIGLCGGGNIHSAHIQAYRKISNVEIVAVCALPKDAKNFAKKWSVKKIYTDIEKICRDPNIDVIDIGLPVYLHSKAAILAAEDGKGVFCEKPLAINSIEARSMVNAVEKHKVFNAYLENYTFFPWAEEAKKCVESGAFGKTVWMRYSNGGAGPYYTGLPWFFEPELSGGGCLIDLGCHSIEVERWILGKKIPSKAFGWNGFLVNKQAIEGGVEDYNIALVKYDEELCECESIWSDVSGGRGIRFELRGTEGTMTAGYPASGPDMNMFSTAAKENTRIVKALAGSSLDKGWFPCYWLKEEFIALTMLPQMEHVVKCYLEEISPRSDFRDGLIVNTVIDAVYRSANSGKWEEVVL